MSIAETALQEFRDIEFIVFKKFFNRKVMDNISACLDKLRDKQPGDNQEAMYYEKSPITGENILVRIEHVLGDHNPELTKLLLIPKANRYLTQLLGVCPVSAYWTD